MRHFHDVANDLRQPTRDLRTAILETWGPFREFAVTTDQTD